MKNEAKPGDTPKADLPKIPYDREQLQEIIVELPTTPEIVAKVQVYVGIIENRVSEIHRLQAKKYPENFYQDMRTALLEIKNVTRTIYELIKTTHPSRPTTLGNLILDWIEPLETVLKYLEISPLKRKEIERKTKYLYASQSFICRQPALQHDLMKHLGELKQLFSKPRSESHELELAPRCYISYAWPSQRREEQEYWVQPFLTVLYDHLTAAGIRVVMDIRDNKPGQNIHQFMRQYQEGDYVILVGTESLLEKHYSVIPHAVQTELNILSNRTAKDQKQFGQSRVYPMLISGTLETAYPERYQLYSTVRDAKEARDGYLGVLQSLTDWVYENRVNVVYQDRVNLWRRIFDKISPSLPKPKDIKAIELELAYEYHKQRRDDLRQDIQIQEVKKEPVAVQSDSAFESCHAASLVASPVQTVQEAVVVSESLVNSNHPTTRNTNQPSGEESSKRLLAQIPNNGARIQRTYCPYFSKAALISFSVLAAGVALEAGRRYYSKF